MLLPDTSAVTYPGFLAVFLLAQTIGLLSQVPGGLGVLESLIVLFLSSAIPASKILAALLLYRLIYYLLPLTVAIAMLGIHELFARREDVKRLAGLLGKLAPEIMPRFLVGITFLGGALMLVSGAVPDIPERLARLAHFVTLPFLEASHFLSALLGAALLILSRGLQRRLDAAYQLTIILLIAGIFLSLFRGFEYEEAIVLSVILGLLLSSRKYFYRKTSILTDRFSPGWIFAIAATFAGASWLGFFAYRHVEYSHELLWQFAIRSDAPRFLRAMVGVATGLVLFGIARLFRPTAPEPFLPDEIELDKARAVIAHSRNTRAYLALLGDKNLLFSGRAFLMYGVEGRSWIVMGDAVGPEDEGAELIWRLCEMCDRHAGWPVFYEAGSAYLPVYLDLGLTPLKIGEEARVSLSRFTLENDEWKSLRRTLQKVERGGSLFSIIAASETPSLLPELRAVSDAWLAGKHTREKGFSMGFFSERYMRQFPIAVVRNNGKISAFANVLLGANREELSADLMRRLPDAPNGVMEYLFTRLMIWGKNEGFGWFNLGMAPLSGLEDGADPTLTLWNRLGTQIYRHGEHFYNFQGLRRYKERFNPEWEPKYLVTTGGLRLPHILINLASITSRGLKGAIAR